MNVEHACEWVCACVCLCVCIGACTYMCACVCVHINMASDRKLERNPGPRYILYTVMANTVNLT